MKKYIITKTEKYGESMVHAFIAKNNKEAKAYLAIFMIGNTGIFNLYKVRRNDSLKLIEKGV